MKDFNTLLNEAKKGPAIRPTPFVQKARKLPDALVLVTTKISCNNCGNKYEYPNIHLLIRTDRQRHAIKDWLHDYETLPREKLTVYETADACQSCFDEDEEIYTNGVGT